MQESTQQTVADLSEECCYLRSVADRVERLESESLCEKKQEAKSLHELVDSIFDLSDDQIDNASEEDLAYCIGKLEYSVTRLRTQMSKLQQMRSKTRDDSALCCVCQDGAKTVLLLPCRHLCVCENCSSATDSRRRRLLRCCPICRETVEEMMKIYS